METILWILGIIIIAIIIILFVYFVFVWLYDTGNSESIGTSNEARRMREQITKTKKK